MVDLSGPVAETDKSLPGKRKLPEGIGKGFYMLRENGTNFHVISGAKYDKGFSQKLSFMYWNNDIDGSPNRINFFEYFPQLQYFLAKSELLNAWYLSRDGFRKKHDAPKLREKNHHKAWSKTIKNYLRNDIDDIAWGQFLDHVDDTESPEYGIGKIEIKQQFPRSSLTFISKGDENETVGGKGPAARYRKCTHIIDDDVNNHFDIYFEFADKGLLLPLFLRFVTLKKNGKDVKDVTHEDRSGYLDELPITVGEGDEKQELPFEIYRHTRKVNFPSSPTTVEQLRENWRKQGIDVGTGTSGADDVVEIGMRVKSNSKLIGAMAKHKVRVGMIITNIDNNFVNKDGKFIQVTFVGQEHIAVQAVGKRGTPAWIELANLLNAQHPSDAKFKDFQGKIQVHFDAAKEPETTDDAKSDLSEEGPLARGMTGDVADDGSENGSTSHSGHSDATNAPADAVNAGTGGGMRRLLSSSSVSIFTIVSILLLLVVIAVIFKKRQATQKRGESDLETGPAQKQEPQENDVAS